MSNSKYALDIVNRPMNELELQDLSTEGLKLASRHGQNYYCKLPFIAQKADDKEEEKIPKTTPLSSLLEPMRSESCLKTIVGWWTYEFCYGKYVKQYHSEGDAPKGDITYLGYYESDFDWNKEVAEESSKFRRHKLNRYHSQTYVNGTSCDIIDHRRDTEIRYICDDSSAETYIARVDEPSTCSYIITVNTPYVCSHPHTKPLKNPKPTEIVCRPVLAPDDFAKFQEMEEAAEVRASLLQNPKNDASTSDKNTFTNGDEMQEMFYGQMKSLVDALLPIRKKDKPKFSKKPLFPDIFKQKNKDEESRKVYEAEAIKLIGRFVLEERLQKMDPFKQKLLVMNVADLLKSNQHIPTADLARKIEKYVSTFVGTLEDVQQSYQDLDELEKTMTDSLTNQFMKAVEKIPEELNPDPEDKEAQPVKKKPSIHLKIHKVKNLDEMNKITSEELANQNTDDSGDVDPSWQKLEEDIGQSLEEAGFESEDNHIEIRVVTNNDNLGNVITLRTEEGEMFRDMLLELVTGGSAKNNEEKKQRSLHNNYNLVWKKGDAGFTSLSTFDEDNKEEVEDYVRSPKL